ncbi:hypothetical protein DSO57_1037218 [Entomophthora muscae]|uniref:Uncharacterized protein n=1 Tax=Entomophthora muscae TaxID=34485 RepID=A0ACC2SZ65_9FUNG|nr:hypothetical protein DSO57_1037218 [Entomophthora muscae]
MSDSEQSNQVLDRQAVKLVRLALAVERTRVPLKRETITKLVLIPGARDFATVFQLAQEKLRTVFGMELVELPAKDTLKPGTKQAKTYTLRSTLSFDVRAENPPPCNGQNETKFIGVVMSILSLIFIDNHSISHASLLSHLKRLEITDDKELRDMVAQMIKQSYLHRVKDNQSAAPTTSQSRRAHEADSEGFHRQSYEYSWGPRAKSEVTLESLTFFIKEVFGDDAPPNLDIQLERFDKERLGSHDSQRH